MKNTSTKTARMPAIGQCRREHGLSLMEVMVALALGVVVTGGIMVLMSNSRAAFTLSQGQANLLDNARFVMHEIGYDLHQAGGYGRTNDTSSIDIAEDLANAAGDCQDGFYSKLSTGVNAFANNKDLLECIANEDYKSGTDILVVRYANPAELKSTDLKENTAHVVTSPTDRGSAFIGKHPALPEDSRKRFHRLVTRVYYVKENKENNDLRRITLSSGKSGPSMTDEQVAVGVKDFQVKLGVNNSGDSKAAVISGYLDAGHSFFGTGWPGDVAALGKIAAVRVSFTVVDERPAVDLEKQFTSVFQVPNSGG